MAKKVTPSREVKETTIEELIPDNMNFNKGTEYGGHLMDKSFRKFGAGRSILLDRNNRVIAGNKSLQTFADIGMQNVRVIETDGTELIAVKRVDVDLDTSKGREMALADNATSKANLEWDEDMLRMANDAYAINYDEWGVELIEEEMQSTEEKEVTEDDFNEETEHIEERCKPGDIWQLGEHRLMCGDSTSAECVGKLMGNDKADMVFTDPPYGIDYISGRNHEKHEKEYGRIKNDDLQGEDLGNLICQVFINNKPDADVYICVSPIMQKPFLDFCETKGKKTDAVIVWDKTQPGLGFMAYRRQCEFILFFKGKKFKMGDTSDVDMWRISRDNGQTYVHGTQKPIAVSARAINNSSKRGDIVIDYFGGSGSTLMACEQLERKCRMMELDTHFCDVILARWEKATGKEAVKL